MFETGFYDENGNTRKIKDGLANRHLFVLKTGMVMLIFCVNIFFDLCLDK